MNIYFSFGTFQVIQCFGHLKDLGSNPIQFFELMQPQVRPKGKKQMFLYGEEASTIALPLQDAMHTPLSQLHWHWEMGPLCSKRFYGLCHTAELYYDAEAHVII